MKDKLQHYKNLERDKRSGGIINKDKTFFLARKKVKQKLKQDKQENEQLKDIVSTLLERIDTLEKSMTKTKRTNSTATPN